MAISYLKRAALTPEDASSSVTDTVTKLLDDIKSGGEDTARALTRQFDNWDGEIVVSQDDIAAAAAQVPDELKQHIAFAHDNIRRFAEAQLASSQDCAVELHPGFWAGQKLIPVNSAGCYVPGGRYSHLASAIMSITTAKVAGVQNVTAVSPPHSGVGIAPAVLYTMGLCGADTVLNLGGVQGIAAMANGLFGVQQADILVGPGNQYVAEAKRILFGEVGIDMFAGPTDSLVIADKTADPELVAMDLMGQAEHGYNSPVWLVTDHAPLAEAVMERVPQLIETLPTLNRDNAEAAWRDYAEVILCDTRDEMATVSDDYAPEHLQVQAADLDWWLDRLTAYGSLFLGEETTVAFGDKASGPNHVLPTNKAARYTGGLSVHKFIKTVTWQRSTPEGMRAVAEATAGISRAEGMEGHARTADARLQKFHGAGS
ncbi:histidinol dehydrogenase [Litoreibacter albidus]|uniref:histidinol dehydrogenase n=1 Tax=Litoreibacter albidus TaxID=670155 RepID=UPI003735B811